MLETDFHLQYIFWGIAVFYAGVLIFAFLLHSKHPTFGGSRGPTHQDPPPRPFIDVKPSTSYKIEPFVDHGIVFYRVYERIIHIGGHCIVPPQEKTLDILNTIEAAQALVTTKESEEPRHESP